jgi:2-hydroxy-3-keto-5-methylthiopentenyl-1-phosphate phosphatase
MRLVDDDIKLLYSLQADLITRDPMTQSDLDMVVKITDRILKAKEMKRKLEKEVQLDTKTVKEFINQIFGLIVANASRNVAKSIMTEILDKVIIPFNTTNRITGEDFKYEPEALEAITEKKEKDGDK